MDLDMIDKLSNGLANEPNSQQQQTAVLRLLTFENAWPGKHKLMNCESVTFWRFMTYNYESLHCNNQ